MSLFVGYNWLVGWLVGWYYGSGFPCVETVQGALLSSIENPFEHAQWDVLSVAL